MPNLDSRSEITAINDADWIYASQAPHGASNDGKVSLSTLKSQLLEGAQVISAPAPEGAKVIDLATAGIDFLDWTIDTADSSCSYYHEGRTLRVWGALELASTNASIFSLGGLAQQALTDAGVTYNTNGVSFANSGGVAGERLVTKIGDASYYDASATGINTSGSIPGDIVVRSEAGSSDSVITFLPIRNKDTGTGTEERWGSSASNPVANTAGDWIVFDFKIPVVEFATGSILVGSNLGHTYRNSEAQSYVESYGTTLTRQQIAALDTLISELKQSGLWALCDALWVNGCDSLTNLLQMVKGSTATALSATPAASELRTTGGIQLSTTASIFFSALDPLPDVNEISYGAAISQNEGSSGALCYLYNSSNNEGMGIEFATVGAFWFAVGLSAANEDYETWQVGGVAASRSYTTDERYGIRGEALVDPTVTSTAGTLDGTAFAQCFQRNTYVNEAIFLGRHLTRGQTVTLKKIMDSFSRDFIPGDGSEQAAIANVSGFSQTLFETTSLAQDAFFDITLDLAPATILRGVRCAATDPASTLEFRVYRRAADRTADGGRDFLTEGSPPENGSMAEARISQNNAYEPTEPPVMFAAGTSSKYFVRVWNRSAAAIAYSVFFEWLPVSVGATPTVSVNEVDSGLALEVLTQVDSPPGVGSIWNAATNELLLNEGAIQTVTGQVGQALEFVQSITDRAEILDAKAIQLGNGDFTIGAWVNTNQLGPAQMILGRDEFADNRRDVRIIVNGSSGLRFSVSDGGSTSEDFDSTGSFTINTWFWVMADYRASDRRVRLYLNNSLDSSHSGTIDPRQAPDYDRGWFVGARWTGSAFDIAFDGEIEQPFLVRRLLSDDERAAIYNSGAGVSSIVGILDPLFSETSPTIKSVALSRALDNTDAGAVLRADTTLGAINFDLISLNESTFVQVIKVSSDVNSVTFTGSGTATLVFKGSITPSLDEQWDEISLLYDVFLDQWLISGGVEETPSSRSYSYVQNLAVHSEDLTNGAWTAEDVTVAAEAGEAHPLSAAVFSVTPNTSDLTLHRLVQQYNTNLTNGEWGQISCDLKGNGYNHAVFALGSAAFGGEVAVYVNLTTGEIEGFDPGNSDSLVRAHVASLGDDWYRVTLSAVAIATNIVSLRIYPSDGQGLNTGSTGTVSYAGDGSSGILATRAQLLYGIDFFAGYVLTTGAAAYGFGEVAQ